MNQPRIRLIDDLQAQVDDIRVRYRETRETPVIELCDLISRLLGALQYLSDKQTDILERIYAEKTR